MALTAEQQAMDFNPELQDVSRQRKLAELLMSQGLDQPQGQMISGHYVAPSWTQQLNPMANILAGQAIGNRADTEQMQYAKKLRELSFTEAQGIFEAQKGGNMAAYLQALRGQTPVSKGAATTLQKQLMEGPEWKEAKIPQADGSELHGWVNVKSSNPLSTFVEGGKKPSYTPMEGMKFQYDTGMTPPSTVSAPVKSGQPVQGAPVQNVPAQVAPIQTSENIPILNNPYRPGELISSEYVQKFAKEHHNGNIPAAVNDLIKTYGATVQTNKPVQPNPAQMSNRQSVAPMSNQNGNLALASTGNAAPVSAMNVPGMSPKDRSDANKGIFIESEKERQKELKLLPTAINTAQNAIKTVDQMIGDARLNDKGEIVYESYDPVTKKWVKSTKEEHGGFGQYVGFGVPYLSNVHGTDTASFRTLYESLKGQAFLEAFQTLKGAGQITEKEGEKATDALLKLNNAQSEKDFIKYAREFQESLQKGMELAKNKAGVSPSYRSPVNQPALRWNPKTNRNEPFVEMIKDLNCGLIADNVNREFLAMKVHHRQQ
jgi:hypothetical protein